MNLINNEMDESTFTIENQLRKTFQPMAPNPEFVNRLRKRLVITSQPIIETDSSFYGLLVILLGFISGLILLIFGKQILKIVFEAAGKKISPEKR
jgi:hypothetical protein